MQRINRSNRKFNRSHRRRYQDSDDDVVNIDWAKPLNQIAHDIIQHFLRVDNLPKHHLLAYLNSFTKYCLKRTKERPFSTEHSCTDGVQHNIYTSGPQQQLDDVEEDPQKEVPEEYTDFEVLSCLRPCLLYEANEIRAATLRAIRYYVQTKQALHCLLELNLHHLIARSLDILLDNRTERIQALRLVRHIFFIEPAIFPMGLARCLCAIAGDNSLEKDPLLRAVWATVAELTTINPLVSAHSGCVSMLTRCIVNSATFTTTNVAPIGEICMGGMMAIKETGNQGGGNNNANGGGGGVNCMCTSAMVTSLSLNFSNVAISEAVLSAFLHLYNWPDTRRLLEPKGSDLYYFISPFTDTYAFLHASNAAHNHLNAFQVDVQLEAAADGAEKQQQPNDQQPKTGDAKRGGNGGPNNTNNKKKEKEKEQAQQQAHQQLHVNFEYRTIRYLACKNALLSILRSWPGMFFMCRILASKRPRGESIDALSADSTSWDYSEIYRQTGEENIRSLLDSLRFFGIPEEEYNNHSKVTQMVSGIGKAMGRTSQRSSSYLTTTSFGSKNPLESLISIFHLPYPEVHRHLLELVFDLFGIRPPDWLEDFDEALRCVHYSLINKRVKASKQGQPQGQQQFYTSFDSSASAANNSSASSTFPQSRSYFPEDWQLYEGFIAGEAEAILPARCANRLNFITNYYALLLQCMVEFGLLEALVSVILDSTEKPAVNLATILLGELLYLTGKYLPASAYAHKCQSLPSLVAASISDNKSRRHRALTAITHLNEINELKKCPPKAASLFLQQQLHFCRQPKNVMKAPVLPVRKISVSSVKSNDESIVGLIKSTGVLKTKKDYRDWNWDVIVDLLKHPGDGLRKLDDKDHHRLFIRRLVDFFKPSRKLFSLVSKNSSLMTTDLGQTSSAPAPTTSSQSHHHSSSHSGHQYAHNVVPIQVRSEPIYMENPRLLCIAASALVDFLLDADEARASEFIEDFLLDLDLAFKNVTTKSPSIDEALLPSRLTSTLSHHYFLLVGRFTHSPVGRAWLDRTHIYQYLLDLISLASNDVYMKLIVSSLDYSEAANMCRTLLSKVLTSTPDSARIYATRFLRVLLRAKATHFSGWTIDALMGQLYDPCPAVSSLALDILDEACHGDEACLEKVISHRPTIFHLGDIGVTFFTRFAAHPIGLAYLKESGLLESELSRWHTVFNGRYVRLVEDSLNECFSVHQRSEYGTFGRRNERRHFPNVKRVSTTTYLPPHLYGQLAQSEEGCSVLRDHRIVSEQIRLLAEHIEELLAVVPEKQYNSNTETSDENNNTRSKNRPNEATVLRVKATLWALGHLCTSELGLAAVLECCPEIPVLAWVATLSRLCPVLSLRATCFYVLCLVSSTRRGAQLLADYGWTAIQHSHDETFPINQLEYDNFYYNGRPRFMSADSEGKMSFTAEDMNLRSAVLQDGTVLSVPSTPFFHIDAEGGGGSEQTISLTRRPYSQSSSSSSSYLSMNAHQQQQQTSSNNFKQAVEKSNQGKSVEGKQQSKGTFSLSSSSSSTSIYSTTSSIGCLVTSGSVNTSASGVTFSATTVYNRPRSSSDCVPTGAKQQTQLCKPDGQDSGILEVNHPNGNCSKSSLSKVDESPEGVGEIVSNINSKSSRSAMPPVPAPRNRKISAPCIVNTPTLNNVIESVNRETRSDSNDSSRTANTTATFSASSSTGTGSRSTSFAEYSTTTSNSSGHSHIIEVRAANAEVTVQAIKSPGDVRNVSFSPDSATLEALDLNTESTVTEEGRSKEEGSMVRAVSASSRRTSTDSHNNYRQLPSRQMSLMASTTHYHHHHLTDDPYPSPVDAHGYAQLQAIQRRRVQSLSGNMFFSGMGANSFSASSGVGSGATIDLHSSFEAYSSDNYSRSTILSRRPHSNSVKSACDSDGMPPEILITDPNNTASITGIGRQRKISYVSVTSNSPVGECVDFKRLLSTPNSTFVDHDGTGSSPNFISHQQPHHRLYYNRSNSRVSKGGSFNSVDSSSAAGTQLGALDGLSLGGDSFSSGQMGTGKSEKTQFMSLCLPDCLSLIFYMDEEADFASKTKRVQFSSQLEQTVKETTSSELETPKSTNKSFTSGLRSCISQVPVEKTAQDGLELHTDLKCIGCCLKLRNAEHQQRESVKSPLVFTKSIEGGNDTPVAEYSKFKVELSPQQQVPKSASSHHKKVESTPSTGSSSTTVGRTPRPSVTSITTSSSVITSATIYQRKEVLRLVFNLSGAMYARQAEQGLLILKQRYPAIFEDFCLFSEVCLMMETINYRAQARRFLHELFDEGYLLPQLTLETGMVLKHRLAVNNAISAVNSSNISKQLEVPPNSSTPQMPILSNR